MRIRRLAISNFRAISALELTDLQDVVVIAGPNGCGKSCIFDAIRLLKSVYGGYQPNEWQTWFGEFNINVRAIGNAWASLNQDRTTPVRVAADIELSTAERDYLTANARSVIEDRVWADVVPDMGKSRGAARFAMATSHRVHKPRVDRQVDQEMAVLLENLRNPIHRAEITFYPDKQPTTLPSVVLETVFSWYDPQNLGVIDLHGANRQYGRDAVGGINLNIESSEERLKQSSLYNLQNKYTNLKTEMAAGYIRQLLAREAAPGAERRDSLSETLHELFTTFFPGKAFLGAEPTADGRLLFRVRTPSGAVHDIDDLSSGEKEVLYGYLRIRNASPKHSVLLIDEPELHLNPRLVSGLAGFYRRNLGLALGNQLWLVTHSDTLIREAVGQPGFNVFHLQPVSATNADNQASTVRVAEELERVVVDLVGDLATYRPGAKLVIFEGGGATDFDVQMVATLFPRFQAAVNPISAGSKSRVIELYETLERARQAGHLPGKFYAITDWDGDQDDGHNPSRLRWDVYHIENYLLEPEIIASVLDVLGIRHRDVVTPSGVYEALRACATETTSGLVAHKLRVEVNAALTPAINLRFDPAREDVGQALADAVQRSVDRVSELARGTLTAEALVRREHELRDRLAAETQSDAWRTTFRGREILSKFTGRYVPGMAYEPLRNLIIARMRDLEFEPIGMARVVEKVLTD